MQVKSNIVIAYNENQEGTSQVIYYISHDAGLQFETKHVHAEHMVSYHNFILDLTQSERILPTYLQSRAPSDSTVDEILLSLIALWMKYSYLLCRREVYLW